MTYCRLIPDDADDMARRHAREDAHPAPWEDADPRPTPAQLAADWAEVAAIQDSLSEIEAELAAMSATDPRRAVWVAMAEGARADLRACKAALDAWEQ